MWKVTFTLSRPPKFPKHTRREVINCGTDQEAVAWVMEFYDAKFGFKLDDWKVEPFDPSNPSFEKQLVRETMDEARRIQRQGPRVFKWEDEAPTKPLDNIKCHDLNLEHIWECDYESMFDPTQNKYSCKVCHMKKEDYEARRNITTNTAGSIAPRGSCRKPGSIP